MKRLLWGCAIVLCLVGALFAYREYATNRYGPCINNSSFVKMAITMYAVENDGWFPYSSGEPLQALAECLPNSNAAYRLACHALRHESRDYTKEHESISPDLTLMRYNQGLRRGDTHDLLLLYAKEPSHWLTCGIWKDSPGRLIWTSSGAYGFLSEDEFQSRQAETVAYLKEHGRVDRPRPADSANPTH